MNQPHFLLSGKEDAAYTVLLAHGAGGPMDSGSMSAAANALAEQGFRVARFEFGYMAARRTGGGRRPPPRAEMLIDEYRAAVAALAAPSRLIIGGKSMGGRVASMIADVLYRDEAIVGLLCLGYPFHPAGKPDSLRTSHLRLLATPTLICQGTRDLLGNRDEVAGYDLSERIELLWLEDGDHDLKPRKTISGHTAQEHLATMAAGAWRWANSLSR